MGESQLASKEEVGGKAYSLMRMARLGLPVPPGFVIGTEHCSRYQGVDGGLSAELRRLVGEGIESIEGATGSTLGGRRRPLLVSVRSGAAVSMPGMMDTVLDVGLNPDSVSGLLRMTGNPRFAWDSYRRLIQAYAEVVEQRPSEPYREALSRLLQRDRLDDARELDSRQLEELSRSYLEIFEEDTGRPFPEDPLLQLRGAAVAVFRSWESPRAREYRRVHAIGGLAGTAVTVQAMVFGNMGSTSGSGVGFTRDPVTGEDSLYMDFLFNAQGEDIVSGKHQGNQTTTLAQTLPGVYAEVEAVARKLEREFTDMQDFEFTVQEGRLYVLQCRTGKRTPWAALRIAVDLVHEGVIDAQTALQRLAPYDLGSVGNARVVDAGARPLASGISANRGVAVGEVALDSEAILRLSKDGKGTILVRDDTSTSDIAGLVKAEGVLTRLGGKTSHAAVVARQMDKVCIVGCRALSIEMKSRTCSISGVGFAEGDLLSLDGNTGAVYAGRLDVVVERPLQLLSEVDRWRVTAAAHG